MELLDEQLAGAATPEDVLERLVASLEALIDGEPELIALIFELFALSRRHEEIAAEFGELVRRSRERLAAILRVKQADGAVRLGAEPDEVADVLFAMADGMALRMLAEPGRDWSPTVAATVAAARPLLDA
jgi:AcrR family transcriptional regulator